MEKLERCGYCGVYVRGDQILYSDELNTLSEKELAEAPLGYCPNAMQEHYEQNPPQI